jgi:two-component system, chemotaxis family, chemotaxis protein CheY
LLVDDSDYIRDVLKTLLEQAGHRIVGEAVNAGNAIKEYQKVCPDIVLMDIVLEASETGKTGLDALKEILILDPSAKVLICSGLNEQMLINEAMAIGAKGFIPKPFDPEKLFETILYASDLGIIVEIGNIGASRAAMSLSKITNQPFEIDVPKIETAPAHLVSLLKWSPDQSVTAVHMGLKGQNGCDILLAFELDKASKISQLMTQKIRKTNMATIQNSAIQEMSSITICSFFSALSDFLELKLLPFGPTLVIDSFSAVVDSFLAKMTVSTETAVLFNIRLKNENSVVDGVLIAFFSPEFQNKLISLGKQLINVAKPMFEEPIESD